jgi:hypothetical protein
MYHPGGSVEREVDTTPQNLGQDSSHGAPRDTASDATKHESNQHSSCSDRMRLQLFPCGDPQCRENMVALCVIAGHLATCIIADGKNETLLQRTGQVSLLSDLHTSTLLLDEVEPQ